MAIHQGPFARPGLPNDARQLHELHILSLGELDARLRGESYRIVVEVLLDFRGSKEDFEVDPRKTKARDLVAHGVKMMKGGYLSQTIGTWLVPLANTGRRG